MVRLSDGCGMEPEFGAGDFVYVDPDEPATAGRFVAVQPRPEDAVTVRRLATEDGRRVLRTLDPAVPDCPLDAANETMLLGVVVFRGQRV